MRADDLWCVAWHVDDFFEVLQMGDLLRLNKMDVERGVCVRCVVAVVASLEAGRIRKLQFEKDRYGAARCGRSANKASV